MRRRWQWTRSFCVVLGLIALGCAGFQRALEDRPVVVDDDCQRAMDLQARARLADLPVTDAELVPEDDWMPVEGDADAEAAQAARDLLNADLSDCHEGTVIVVLAAAERFAAELAAVAEADDGEAVAADPPVDNDEVEADTDVGAGTDPGDAPRATGGSVHVVSPETPGAQPIDEACLAYTEPLEPHGLVSLGPCTDRPWVAVELDLAAGTAQGELAMEVSCPGWFRCRSDETSSGTARGSFGPLPITLQPADPPADYPFPAHHYHANTSDWVAAGAVTVDLAIEGSYPDNDETLSAEAADTEQAWVTVELIPTSGGAVGSNPSGWWVRIFLEIDHPGDLYPRWDLAVGLEADITEAGVPRAPRD